MRYFLDTEFNGFGGALLSIALAPRDQERSPFYRRVEFTGALDPWVERHMWPHIGIPASPRSVVGGNLAAYLREDPHPIIVADWPTDFEHLLALLITGPGYMESVPDFAMEFCRLSGFNTADHSKVPHNALADAEALRDECVRRFGY
jgi:hypothetical protein